MIPKERAETICNKWLVGLKDRIGAAYSSCIKATIAAALPEEREACAKLVESSERVADRMDLTCWRESREAIAAAIRGRET